MKNKVVSILLILFCAVSLSARERQLFDEGWLFQLKDSAQMSSTDYNDAAWRQLNLPHDWSIEGDFLGSNPAGAGGGALPGGVGWYRKHFTLKDKDKTSRYLIDFDGVYMNSTVYINGHLLGNRPYGFSSFQYDLTPYINKVGENVIAVRVDNSDQPNCRWYSGCGIYRHVYLLATGGLRVDHWGVFAKSTTDGFDVSVNVMNDLSKMQVVTVRNTVVDASGKIVASKSSIMNAVKGKSVSEQKLTLNNPHLWSVDDPYIYKVKTELIVKGKVVDGTITNVGVRTFKFDSQTGFSLNGIAMKINGVCQHHDLGCLGAAINEDALHRQLRMLKDMGCNAIRCSHNPPSPELLNMCDTMGLMVMDESFDMWRRKKTKNDYARFFDKWFERDLSDLVVRDRNHPSIILWSIGNEVLEQWSSADADTLSIEQANLILNAGHDASTLAKNGEMSVNSLLTRRLVEIVKNLDPTRPVTAGCNEPSPNNHLFKSGALDIIGFNYHRQWIKDVPKNFPGKPFMMTESVSALQTRGYYMMPSDSIYIAPKEWWLPYTDPSYMCSAYDNMHAPWSSTHEQTWDIVKHTPYCSGQFIWTGWDYIGEPTPYNYPARSSYFGIIDLAGFPKDVYYMYQSEWTSKPVLHLFPHWNWVEGQTIDMWCYYNNADEVELYINGKSQGVRRKKDDHQYHVMWRVQFEPGEVKVVARKNGAEVGSQVIKTAGAPDHIRLIADRKSLKADGRSMAFVTVEVVDKDGNLCPNADNQIFFDVKGQGTIAGVDNGCQTSLERFKANNRKAFFGKCLVVIQSTKNAGNVQLTAKSADLKSETLNLSNN
jgi:beta-galactosidase